MKGKKLLHKLLTAMVCLLLICTMTFTAYAAETVEAQPQTGTQDGLILVLSAVAITGLVLLIVIRWGKKKFFEN